MKTVYCLYRVSTLDQVDKVEDDIPLQKISCRRFIDENPDWKLGKEFYEKGVSGFKKSAKERDAIIDLQSAAIRGEFDVLLVFMFDRIGRKDDETPFVVEWFVKQGIEVWSVNEGQQRFDTHVDKLLNYIRYWQASGESIKTSIRVKNKMQQMVEEDHFKGGIAPYGYKLVNDGRKNKKGRDVLDLAINEDEVDTAKLIFHLHADCGLGPHSIAKRLYDMGIVNRSGESFTAPSIRNMVMNPVYIGMLKFNEEQFGPFERLRIIEDSQFERSQELIKERSKKFEETRNIPRKPSKRCLLGGNIFCGHCGGRLNASSAGRTKTDELGNAVKVHRPRYVCYNRSRHRGKCSGQTTYSAKSIDSIVLEVVTNILDKLKGVPVSVMMEKSYGVELNDANQKLDDKRRELAECQDIRENLVNEISASLIGSSIFTPEVLAEAIDQNDVARRFLEEEISELEENIADTDRLKSEISAKYDEIISWSDILESSDISHKRMAIAQIVDRVEVSRGYKIVIHMSMTMKRYLELMGDDEAACISANIET